MSADKYRSICLCQMEVIVYLNVTTSSRVCCSVEQSERSVESLFYLVLILLLRLL